MSPIVRNILAVVLGFISGSVVNMLLVNAGPAVFPPPEGADITSYEGLKATMHLMQPRHFVFPFLAHALGTLVGALVAARMAASHHRTFALVIGLLFLAGGIANILMLPSPVWFTVLDLAGTYLPMAWLGWKWSGRK